MARKKSKTFAITSLTLLLSALLCYFTLIITSVLIEDLADKENLTIQQIAYIADATEPKTLSKLLRASLEFEFLTIKDQSGHVFYRYIKNQEDLPTLYKTLDSLSLLPGAQTITIEYIVINYHSSFERFLTPMYYVLILAALLPFILTLSLLAHRRVLNLNFNYLHKQLSLFLNGDSSANLPNKFVDLMVAHQFADDEHRPTREQNTKYDPLTGMRSGHQFVYDYDYHQLEAKNTKADNCAVLILLRVKNLKQINYKNSFDQGDKCLTAVADTIKEVFPNRHDKLYKLNGVDFGIVLNDCQIEPANAFVANIIQRIQGNSLLSSVGITLGSAALEFNHNTQISTLLATADDLADSPYQNK